MVAQSQIPAPLKLGRSRPTALLERMALYQRLLARCVFGWNRSRITTESEPLPVKSRGDSRLVDRCGPICPWVAAAPIRGGSQGRATDAQYRQSGCDAAVCTCRLVKSCAGLGSLEGGFAHPPGAVACHESIGELPLATCAGRNKRCARPGSTDFYHHTRQSEGIENACRSKRLQSRYKMGRAAEFPMA
jgi:hypothetical protein